MKTAHYFAALPHVRYRPEVTTCPFCGAPLHDSHAVWAKPIQFLRGSAQVTNLGFRGSNPGCPDGRTVHRSAQAEAQQVNGSGHGLDVVVRVGHLRLSEYRTQAEIWQALGEEHPLPLQLSARHVRNRLAVYLALLRASQ